MTGAIPLSAFREICASLLPSSYKSHFVNKKYVYDNHTAAVLKVT